MLLHAACGSSGNLAVAGMPRVPLFIHILSLWGISLLQHSSLFPRGSILRGQVLIKSSCVSYLLMSCCSNQVTWSSPETVWDGTIQGHEFQGCGSSEATSVDIYHCKKEGEWICSSQIICWPQRVILQQCFSNCKSWNELNSLWPALKKRKNIKYHYCIDMCVHINMYIFNMPEPFQGHGLGRPMCCWHHLDSSCDLNRLESLRILVGRCGVLLICGHPGQASYVISPAC